MPKLVVLKSARQDYRDILRYIVERSGSLETGKRFLEDLKAKTRHLASLPPALGRKRPELGDNIRTFTFKSYILIFRYRGDRFELINVLHGHRDIEAFFDESGD